jgi:hypothetical protein
VTSGERPNGERGQREQNLQTRLADFARRLRPLYDTRPVTRDEWDAASGDERPIVPLDHASDVWLGRNRQ